jgi:5'-nucleotidase
MRILIANDDGYLAPGLAALVRACEGLGTIDVVAPEQNASGTSNALTLNRPLSVFEAASGYKVVNGTPSDCVHVALTGLLPQRPDLVLSGINNGANMGDDTLYSGTVAAAMEATVIGIPAVAVSYTGDHYEELEGWEGVIRKLLEGLLRQPDFPKHTLFNVNLPGCPPDEVKGIRVTSLGKRRYSESITRANDPSGREYFWIGGGSVHWRGPDDSDFQAVRDGFISVTPLHLDLTNYRLLEEIRGWDLAL